MGTREHARGAADVACIGGAAPPILSLALRGEPARVGTLGQRFRALIEHSAEGEHWLWTGARTSAGLCHMRVDAFTTIAAPRLAVLLSGRPLHPRARQHKLCDVDVCVNPAHHSWTLTARARPVSRRMGRPPLSDEAAERIRHEHRQGLAIRDLARRYRQPIRTVAALCRGLRTPRRKETPSC